MILYKSKGRRTRFLLKFCITRRLTLSTQKDHFVEQQHLNSPVCQVIQNSSYTMPFTGCKTFICLYKVNSVHLQIFPLSPGPFINHRRLRKIRSTEWVLCKEALSGKGVFSFNKKTTKGKYDIATKKSRGDKYRMTVLYFL